MLLIIAVAVVLFVWNKLPVVLVAMAVALALWATGVLTIGQALSGFGDPAVIFIASLFVVSTALEMTGVTAWAGQLLIRGAGEESRTRLLILTMLLVALLTALISVNGAVAALLPVVVVIAIRLKRNSSQLLMPLVFAAHAGSMLALTGTPVNVLVSDAAMDASGADFGFFEFALVGVPLLPARWRSSWFSESGCCPSATARPCPPTSAATPRRWSSNMGWQAASTRPACAPDRRLSARRQRRST